MRTPVNSEARTVRELLASLKDTQDLYIIYGFTGKDHRVKVIDVDEHGTIKTSSKHDISRKLFNMLINPRYIIMERVEKGWLKEEDYI